MIKEFFNQNPNATQVLKVGDDLFLAGFYADAVKLAKSKGLAVEAIDRPIKVKSGKDEEITANVTT
jgi:hypothetical protein